MAPLKVNVLTLTEMLPLLTEYEQHFDAVERCAYHLFENRGSQHGKALDDWLGAQHDMLCLPQMQPGEDDDCFYALMSLHGFQSRDLRVFVSPTDAVIRAQSPLTDLPAEIRLRAISHYRFREPIDPGQVSASFDRGILRVMIPKMSHSESYN